MIEEIIQQIDICPKETDKLYLLKTLEGQSGFFFYNNHVLFGVEEKSHNHDFVETEQLILCIGVEIRSVVNSNSFKAGKYSYIQFNGIYDRENVDFINFIHICVLYNNEKNVMSLNDFFFSIIEMFQLPKEQSYNNLLGLYGELCVLYDVYKVTGKNISDMWHKKSSDKFDFTDGKIILEVKTTTSKYLEAKIKHQQLFDKDGIVLGIVQLYESNAGKSLNRIIEELNDCNSFKNNFQFQLVLAKELKRINPQDAFNKQFSINNIKYFLNNNIVTFDNVSSNISELSYIYSFEDIPTISLNEVFK